MKITIWGTGLTAAEFTYQNRNRFDIDGYIDNNGEMKEFLGKRVLTADGDEIRKHSFIIVATSWGNYADIKEQLRALGKIEFDDFIHYTYLDKKIACIYGNCHTEIISLYLNSSLKFRNKYFIVPMPAIQNLREIDYNLIEHCDLFVHQTIRKENEFGYDKSDENILPHLKLDCIQIAIPNLFNLGKCFFPQCDYTNSFNMPLGADRNGFFPNADLIIDKMIDEHMDNEEIERKIGEIGLFEQRNIVKDFSDMIDKVRSREEKWDVKIADFLLKNYREHRLFYDPGHPTNYVINYISNEILTILGFDEVPVNYVYGNMGLLEIPIYESVKAALGLQYDVGQLNEGRRTLVDGVIDMHEYIKEYRWLREFLCHN